MQGIPTKKPTVQKPCIDRADPGFSGLQPAEYGDGTERLPNRTEVAPCADSIPAAAFRSGGPAPATDGQVEPNLLL